MDIMKTHKLREKLYFKNSIESFVSNGFGSLWCFKFNIRLYSTINKFIFEKIYEDI